MDLNKYKVAPDKAVDLANIGTFEETGLKEEEVKEKFIPDSIDRLRELQTKLFAEEKKGILVVLQAIDAAGKDEIITFIFSHLLAQGLKVTSVKEPTKEEAAHDLFWRIHDGLPERGQVAILNRSYYEDLIQPIVSDGESGIPMPASVEGNESPWETRARHINQFEKYLVENGFPVVKIFLSVSKEEQRKRLLERMKNEEKHWEFSFSDMVDRDKWDKFQEAFEKMLNHTSTPYAPWYALPADNEWFNRYVASEIVIDVLEKIDPHYPVMSGEDKQKLEEAIEKLEKE
ncbi:MULTISPECIES: PPK2 family polyphosphate kinase [unclassified Jeotgalibaca]|uniref:PPK2 family polyphosphate kinase n=1 Tax=unclassified Jeotgalibaca TaxID=2621505 RepID=UPI003FD4AAFF